ncbi:hypothetical protein [Burkholderia sp. WAC0059]|uniref:hypothetical protein n=1 Tax=Burkholderia sp. WAC0059 TaxID=2066022 RepID=UPI0011AF3374|nr:hypothetical protein [Burkholderia sp. WAC0059]
MSPETSYIATPVRANRATHRPYHLDVPQARSSVLADVFAFDGRRAIGMPTKYVISFTHAQPDLSRTEYARVRARIINHTEHRKRKIRLVVETGNFSSEWALADELPGAVYSDVEIDVPAVNIPIPGTRAAMEWTGLGGRANSDEFVVTGELPRAEGEGLAIVRFARDFRVYVRMYAEEQKPVRRW